MSDAMAQSENCVSTIAHTFGRAESQKNNISQYVGASDCELESDKEYRFVIVGRGRVELDNEPLSFTRYGHNSSDSFTIPYKVIKRGNIKPGHAVSISVYEMPEETAAEEEEKKESERFLDLASACSDASRSDNVDSRIYSKVTARYLRNHGNDKIEYTNKRTGESTIRNAKADYAENSRISLPKDVRKEINIKPDDEIGLAIPEEVHEQKENENDGGLERIKEMQEAIDEMHAMISELYDAYTEVKND